MFVLNNTVVTSATDLVQSATCEFAFLRKLDQKLGRDVVVPDLDDEMMKRAGLLGDKHEAKQLAAYRSELGQDLVAEIARPANYSVEGLNEREKETVTALNGEAQIVFQATFFHQDQVKLQLSNEMTISFIGYADFLARVHDASGGDRWQVQDTKLARIPKPAALIQIVAYADQLKRLGFKVDEVATIILGDGKKSEHKLSEVTPIFLSRRDRMYELIDLSVSRQNNEITKWNDPGFQACGRCEVCEPEVTAARDPLMIGGITKKQRDNLFAAGIKTIDQVAKLNHGRAEDSVNVESANEDSISVNGANVDGISRRVLQKLISQARLQIESESKGCTVPAWEILDATNLSSIPEPSSGDLFFDFEGDPLFQGRLSTGAEAWGIDYLFGVVDNDENFTAFWAHDFKQEKQALIDFIDFVSEIRSKHPDMHIYHYAPYEKTHLKLIAARHGVCEDEVDDLLRNDVLVDLYYIVKQSLLVGSKSYSIKKLEPLYMHDKTRDATGVTTGADSITEYALAAELVASDDSNDRQLGQLKLEAIEEYNKYDCVSTLRLRDWLLEIAEANDTKPVQEPVENADEAKNDRALTPEAVERSALSAKLLKCAEYFSANNKAKERDVFAMAASAIDYHKREQKSFWWEHYERLVAPLEEWADIKDVFLITERPEIVAHWGKPPKARKDQRQVKLRGTFAPGSSISEGTEVFAVYETSTGPDPLATQSNRVAHKATILTISKDASTIILKELTNQAGDHWSGYPVALTPGPPPHAGSQVGAIADWGKKLQTSFENTADLSDYTLPQDPVVDIMARLTPLLKTQGDLTSVESETALKIGGNDENRRLGAVTASVLDLERSALAVQGPPGTGKTYLAARVIKYLVEKHSWRIGVVAQSHRVVENVLDGVVKAGLNKSLVVKELQRGTEPREHLFTKIKAADLQVYVTERDEAQEGFVVGGTAWLFSNEQRVPRDQLDLLVIDEAGQFSLAPTIAASVAAKRLLLLGDPQQLPQVSQGTHPEPVDESALGWLTHGHETLPLDLGYFLAETRRMRPELTQYVSTLSYANKLKSHESTSNLTLTGASSPGLIWHPVDHHSNSTSSIEEAERVLEIVRETLQAQYSIEGQEAKQLTQEDIVVVAPYNAQVELITMVLQEAGLEEIRVGTVDKFQGQEALVSIVSLAASSPDDVPRGLDFLLMPNRLNVAISRAKWSAHLVSSRSLGGSGLPTSLSEMRALSGYLMLTGRL